MPGRIRFHLDEHIPGAVADGLRRRGIDVTTSVELELTGRTDEEQLAAAHDAGRVLVSHDADFTALHRRGVNHSGIAYCHQGGRAINDLLRALILLWEVLTPEDMQDHLEFL